VLKASDCSIRVVQEFGKCEHPFGGSSRFETVDSDSRMFVYWPPIGRLTFKNCAAGFRWAKS